jgi:hypothetical protein
MSRSIHASVVTELAKDSVKMCHLLEIHLSSTSYLTDAGQDISYGGNTYLASSHFLNVSTVKEESEVRVGTSRIRLSGVEQSFISALLSSGYVGRQLLVYRAFLDATNGIIGIPVLIYDGRISEYEILDTPETSTVDLGVASHWSDFEKKAGRHTNSNSQGLHFSGDKGFDFAANVVKDLKWGRE